MLVEVGAAIVELTVADAARLAAELSLLGTLPSLTMAAELERATATATPVHTPDDPVDALLLLRAVEHLRNLSVLALDQEPGTASEPQFTAGLDEFGDRLLTIIGATAIAYEIELPEGGVYEFWSSSGPYWADDRVVASRRAWRVVSATQPIGPVPGLLEVEPWADRPTSNFASTIS